MSPVVSLFRFIARTRAEGPGWRACLWVQGCSLECAGCFNRHLWPATGSQVVPAERLLEAVLETDGIEGVTFLGGEPFEQAEALAWLAERVSREGLSVMCFTGYRLEELRHRGAGARDLLASTDLLVDGRFVRTLLDTRRAWVGSTNQRFHYLTDRYANFDDDSLRREPDRLEVRLAPGGAVFVNGMAPVATLASVREAIEGIGQ